MLVSLEENSNSWEVEWLEEEDLDLTDAPAMPPQEVQNSLPVVAMNDYFKDIWENDN